MLINATRGEALAFLERCAEVYEGNKARGFWEEKRSPAMVATLVISELMEAVEADRRDLWADEASINMCGFDTLKTLSLKEYKTTFKRVVKDTVQDEAADAAIRCMDYIGACLHGVYDEERGAASKAILAVLIMQTDLSFQQMKNNQRLGVLKFDSCSASFGFVSTVRFNKLFDNSPKKERAYCDIVLPFIDALFDLFYLDLKYGLNIARHIVLKLDYNSTRPYKHGKTF